MVIVTLFLTLAASLSFAGPVQSYYNFPSCSPESEIVQKQPKNTLSPKFCAEWNPEFPAVSRECCGVFRARGRRLKAKKLTHRRRRRDYCSDMTMEQRRYIEDVRAGRANDILDSIKRESSDYQDQAFCTEHDGFLAFGRPIVPTLENRIKLNEPALCLNFGTDSMVGMLEWLGRFVAKKYSELQYGGVHLNIGDISAPKGGRIVGRTGGNRHLSHMTGQDVDLGFITARPWEESPPKFTNDFKIEENWELIQRVFQNPFACVKAVFLDRSHIRKLAKFARNDKNWKVFKNRIRHMPHHKNHFHVRIGKSPDDPGCLFPVKPEVEFDDDESISESVSNPSQSTRIEQEG